MTNFQARRALLNTSALVGAIALSFGMAGAASAQVSNYDIPSEPLSKALRDYGQASGRQIIFTEDLVRGHTTQALHGSYSSDVALARLLDGTGLVSELRPSGAVMIERPVSPQVGGAHGEPATTVQQVVVTGSHIRGEASAAPTDIITSKRIEETGYSQVGDVIRSLPETFGGGQNPGVLQGAAVTNIGNGNLSNASTVNLRGLGSDATLVLLNGHRLAADGGFQGTDISVIPLDAIERIEIVTDGASAVYGSDAVAGVANFILRKDYQGLELSERVGEATQGGGLEQTYNLLGGQTWSTGHLLAGVQYTHQDQISAGQRSFTADAAPIDALIQAQTQTSYFVNAEQTLVPWATFHMDGVFAKRETGNAFEYTSAGPAYISAIPVQSYLIAPGLTFTLPGDWSATLDGSASATDDYDATVTDGSLSSQHYQNATNAAELSATGTAVRLPMGPIKLAIGGGYLRESFKYSDSSGNLFPASRTVASIYGEAAVPFIAPSETRVGLHSLDLTLAGRVEHYSDFGTTANPKIGLRYVPLTGLGFRATWGTSFKTPELLQTAESKSIFQYNAADVGSTMPGIALLTYGGNTNLKPERANSWTAGVDWSPPTIQGLKVSLTYFHIDYRDRIVQPIGNVGDAVTDPIYAPFVTLNPTPATQAAAINSSATFYNLSSSPYNSSQVVALIQDQYFNATSQKIQGIDFSVKQSIPLALGRLDAQANMSWLDIVQQTLPGSAPQTLSGTLFNPPKLRARIGATWSLSRFTATGAINYISGETDNGVVPSVAVSPWTTADLNLSYKFERLGARWPGLEAALSISNLFDQDPPVARGASALLPGVNFDSTNTSPIGRFVALTLRERF